MITLTQNDRLVAAQLGFNPESDRFQFFLLQVNNDSSAEFNIYNEALEAVMAYRFYKRMAITDSID